MLLPATLVGGGGRGSSLWTSVLSFSNSLCGCVSYPENPGGSGVGGMQTLYQAGLSLTCCLTLAELLYKLRSPHP